SQNNVGQWQPWQPLSGSGFTGDPTVAQNDDGRLEVFVRGNDNQVWHKPGGQGDNWGDWWSLGSPPGELVTSNPAVTLGHGELHVFVRARDRAIWYRHQHGPNGGWDTGWQSLG